MLFDIGVGLLLAVGIGVATGRQPEIIFALLGAAGALAPDLDVPVWLLRTRGRIDEWMHRHRDILHYPLLLIPVLLAAGWFFFDRTVGILLGSGATAHFLHDSGREGWGIRWLWPFNQHYFQVRRTEGHWHLDQWTRARQDEIVRRQGDPFWWKEAYGSRQRWIRELLLFILGSVATATWLVIG